MISFHLGDHVQLTDAAPVRQGETGVVTYVGRTIVIRFLDDSVGAFLPDEVELERILSESSNIFYFRRGSDIFRYAHGNIQNYCTINGWPKSRAVWRANNPRRGAVSLGPERNFFNGLPNAQRVG